MNNKEIIEMLKELYPIGKYTKTEPVISIMDIEKIIENLEKTEGTNENT